MERSRLVKPTAVWSTTSAQEGAGTVREVWFRSGAGDTEGKESADAPLPRLRTRSKPLQQPIY